MAKTKKQKAAARVSLGSLAKSLGLLRSEVRISSQGLEAGLAQVRDEMRTGFDQLYRHIDGFVQRHETLISSSRS
jgi:hypothetical protein